MTGYPGLTSYGDQETPGYKVFGKPANDVLATLCPAYLIAGYSG